MDAETVLFVDDDKPEIGESDIGLEQGVGAGNDLDLARSQPGKYGRGARQPGSCR